MVHRRPPHLHLLHKHRERTLNGHVDSNAFSHDGFLYCLCHVSLLSSVVRPTMQRYFETRPGPSPKPDRSAPAAERHPLGLTDTSVSSLPCYRSPVPRPSTRVDAATPPDG